MKFFRRRPKLPAALRPELAPDERVLSWAAAGAEPGGPVLVATNLGLFLPGRAERLGWHEIHKVAWSGREMTVTPSETAQERPGYTVLVDAPAETFLLLAPGEVPEQVRTRVTKSVAYTQHYALDSGGGVRVVGRRVPGVNGLTWAVRYDTGTHIGLDEVIAATDALVADAQEATAPPD